MRGLWFPRSSPGRDRAALGFVEFFTVNIRKPSTRAANDGTRRQSPKSAKFLLQ
jgi:hypothetical protein